MSEFYVKVVEIGKVGKHPNADNLSITQVLGNYPVIFQTGQFNQGDKAVYVSVDALVPLADPRWRFLTDDLKERFKIKAKKLRGIFSMGILTEADPSWEVGQDVQNELNIEKWLPEVELTTSGDGIADPGYMPKYTDIEGLRRYANVLEEGEEVILTEKIHGANARFVYKDGAFWVGSRSQYKLNTPDKRSAWWSAAISHDLEKKLSEYPGMALYGEVYGPSIQDLGYGVDRASIGFVAFDVFNTDSNGFLNYDAFEAFCKLIGVPTAPVLYRGPWNLEQLKSLAEGKTVLGKELHVREGFVARPIEERWNNSVGRVILKFVGEGYLTRKGA